MADGGQELALIDRPRTAFTDGSIAGVVRARKRYPCGSHLADRHYIEPGEQYVANALPPDNPDICNSRWMHLRVCLDCCPVEHDPRPRPAPPGTHQNPVDGRTHSCEAPGYRGSHTAVGAGAVSSPYLCHGCSTWFVIPDEASR